MDDSPLTHNHIQESFQNACSLDLTPVLLVCLAGAEFRNLHFFFFLLTVYLFKDREISHSLVCYSNVHNGMGWEFQPGLP